MKQPTYLIAIALIEKDGERLMPLGGRSLKESLSGEPGSLAEGVALQLLLRVLQRSDEGRISRAFADKSLLLIEIPMQTMNDIIPALKSEWLKTGDSENLISKLKLNSINIWSIFFVKHEGVIFSQIH